MMTIIADENIDHRIIHALQQENYDVYSVYFSNRGMTDLQIAAFSFLPPKIILTEDKDFGEMVFQDKIQGLSVVLLRYQYPEANLIIVRLLEFLKFPLHEIENHFTTISLNKTRSRKI